MNIALYLVFLAAFACYQLTGRTLRAGYMAMRGLHGASDGRFNDRCLSIARCLRPAAAQDATGFLGDWRAAEIERVAAALDRDGIGLLERPLPPAACAALESFARTTAALPIGGRAKVPYERERASALRYDFDEADIVQGARVRGEDRPPSIGGQRINTAERQLQLFRGHVRHVFFAHDVGAWLGDRVSNTSVIFAVHK